MLCKSFEIYELDDVLPFLLNNNVENIQTKVALYEFKFSKIEENFEVDFDTIQEELLLYKLEINKIYKKKTKKVLFFWGELGFYFSGKQQRVVIVLKKNNFDLQVFKEKSNLKLSFHLENSGLSFDDFIILPEHSMDEKDEILRKFFREIFKMLD